MAEIARLAPHPGPDEFDEVCLFNETIRHLPGVNGGYFLHATCVPLRQIDVTRTRSARRALLG